MSKVIRIEKQPDAQKAEKFIFDALQPNGFAYNPSIPLPNLKDQLAWLSSANLMRPEQPSFVALENSKIVAGMFGEPVETTFDVGESEIQTVIFKPGTETKNLALDLLSKIVIFYQQHHAKQVHFWILESDFNQNNYATWQQVALDSFGFAFKDFRRFSKWSGQPICKIEKYF